MEKEIITRFVLRRKRNKFIFSKVVGMWEIDIITYSFKKNEHIDMFIDVIKKYVAFDKDGDWLLCRCPNYVYRWEI